MNFIRLPSLKSSHYNDESKSHPDNPNSILSRSDNKSYDSFLPFVWKHYQPPQTTIHDHPILPSQSYAQEMFSYADMDKTPTSGNPSQKPPKRRRRSPHSYASMIAQAILTSKEQKMSLRDIYTWVQQRYPHLYETNETGWQYTIRHNLSLNRCFYKLPKATPGRGKGKGGYWAVSLDQLNSTTFGKHLLDSGTISGFEYWQLDDMSVSTLSDDAFQTSPDSGLFLQAANLATLQQHQAHINQRRNVARPSALSIPFKMDSTYDTTNDNPTFHPPALHHILN
ncbi:fork head domain-containing protein [Chlamydoabsidia padenii]|nr:fork head domain-containing protein [Chlamydoabsidia padenii]